MRLLSLRRDIKDLNRLREIVTILVKQGFHGVLAKAKLVKHAKVAERLKSDEQKTTPKRVRETLEALGPTFVKLGQILSLRPDLIPQAYCDEFAHLQDEVRPLTFPIVQGVIEAELGCPLKSAFKHVDHTPLAAASVAQVHKAVLKDGRNVVIKVQRPGVHAVMLKDIDIMEYLAEKIDKHVPEISIVEIVKEFKNYTKNELDFGCELRTLKKFKAFFADNDEVLIPEPFPQYSTKKILVMEHIKGVSLRDKKALSKAHFHLKTLAGIGFRSLFDMVFKFGLFHADPHPGNVLAVRRDGKEVLALLDFGIVGVLDKQTQDKVWVLFNALVSQDTRTITRVFLELGTGSSKLDAKALEHEIGRLVMLWHGSTIEEEHMSTLLHQIINACIKNGLALPADFVLMAKAFITIEGLALWLHPEFNPVEALQPALAELRSMELDKRKAELVRTVQGIGSFANKLPLAADALLDRIEEGKVELSLDQKEFRRWEREKDLETSRQTLALTCAAFFIGSSVIAALAPELLFLNFPLWQVGFTLFIVTLLMFGYVTIKTHKYVEDW
jgi:ubiquinone biosynthesis protein